MRLIDTSVAIDYLRGYHQAVVLLQEELEANGSIAASEVTRFELLAGARQRELEGLEAFFTALEWIPVGERVTRQAASYARRFRRSHGEIDAADYLIAATAELLGALPSTMNVRHFPMFPDLQPPYRYAT